MRIGTELKVWSAALWLAAATGTLASTTNTWVRPESPNTPGLWSDGANWSLGHMPTAGEMARFTNASFTITNWLDVSTTLDGIICDLFGFQGKPVHFRSDAGCTMTCSNFYMKAGGGHLYFYVPVILNNDGLLEANAYGGKSFFYQPISGDFKLKTRASMHQLYATNTFNGLEIESGTLVFYDGGLGVGPVTLGLDAKEAALSLYVQTGNYALSTNVVTVKPGGTRRFRYGYAISSATLPLTFVLEGNLQIYTAGAGVTKSYFTGPFSGTGGLELAQSAPANYQRIFLCASNTYGGGTVVTNGALLVASCTNNGSATGTNYVNVYSNSTLAGYRRVAGPVNIMPYGILAPGTNELGTNVAGRLEVGGDLSMGANSVYKWDYGAATQDTVNVAGTVSLPSVATLRAVSMDGSPMPARGVLFTAEGGLSVPALDWTVTGPTNDSYHVRAYGNQVIVEKISSGTILTVY